MVRVTTLTLIAFTLVVGSIGCKGHRSSMPTNEPLTDAQVAAVLITVHQGEVDAAVIATRRSSDQLVLGFAARMQSEHRGAWDRLTALATTQGFALEGSQTSQHITEHNARLAQELNDAAQDRFDETYLRSQVAGHQRVLDLIDDTLLVRVTNADLRAEIDAQRAAVVLHKEHVDGALRQYLSARGETP